MFNSIIILHTLFNFLSLNREEFQIEADLTTIIGPAVLNFVNVYAHITSYIEEMPQATANMIKFIECLKTTKFLNFRVYITFIFMETFKETFLHGHFLPFMFSFTKN